MHDDIRITVLIENSVHLRGLRAEHGWACLVEVGGRRVLFDTGQSELLLHNAGVLGCSLENLDAIVLSHGHDDHSGGLAVVRKQSPAARVFLHPAALNPKFSATAAGGARHIGMPETGKRALARGEPGLNLTLHCQEVIAGLFVTGEIPRQTDFEDVGGRFFLDGGCQHPDPLTDDQAVFLEAREGLVVLVGCAHAGVVNTLNHIGRLTGGKPIHALVGGMHLGSASERRLEQTVARLREINPGQLLPAHCTGMAAAARLWTEFPGRCRLAAAGTTLTFPR